MSKQRFNFKPLLTQDEVDETFPLVFEISFDYQIINRLANLCESLGTEAEILTTGAGYALVLHHPDEAG